MRDSEKLVEPDTHNKNGLDNLNDYCDVIPCDTLDSDALRDKFMELLSFNDPNSSGVSSSNTNSSFLQKTIVNSYIFIYFLNYLKNEDNGSKIGTVVVEKNYTCLNFLEDFVNYYARCYTPYKKTCKRLHLFSGECFGIETFKDMIIDPESVENKKRWDSYQGCIVVKPIPKGVFGVTFLKHYDAIAGNDEHVIHPMPKRDPTKRFRYYKCLTKKTVNIFGVNRVIKTMPFKEQDGIVASCATTAMWMAFQKTAELFHAKAPSLSEITILAGENDNIPGKIFPSQGLRVSQVCRAIYNLGMLAEIKDKFQSISYFKAYVHAYLQGDIPVLFGFNMIEEGKNENHLVTINGYRYNSVEYGNLAPGFISDSIEKFYVHDDQIGPFARIEICETPLDESTIYQNEREDIYDSDGVRKKNDHLTVVTAWWKDYDTANKSRDYDKNFKKDSDNYKKARPDYLIVPLSSSIKVTFDNIYDKYLMIQYMSRYYLGASYYNLDLDLGYGGQIQEVDVSDSEKEKIIDLYTWNILIIKNNDYKTWLHRYFKNCDREDVLGTVDVIMLSLPKYIWVIQAYIGDDLMFDFIFDTVENNIYGQHICANIYAEVTKELIKNAKLADEISNSFSADTEKYNKSLLKELNENLKVTPQIRRLWHSKLEEIDKEMAESRSEGCATKKREVLLYEKMVAAIIDQNLDNIVSDDAPKEYQDIEPHDITHAKIIK